MDVFSTHERSRIMSRIRSKGNKSTELRLIDIMRQSNITGWRRGSLLPGKPDFVFHIQRIALFVDGDFWHGNPTRFQMPRTNKSYWRSKIERNKKRDKTISLQLRRMGWCVIRLWESQLRNEAMVVRRLIRAIA